MRAGSPDRYVQRQAETDAMAAHMRFIPFLRGILMSGVVIIPIPLRLPVRMFQTHRPADRT